MLSASITGLFIAGAMHAFVVFRVNTRSNGIGNLSQTDNIKSTSNLKRSSSFAVQDGQPRPSFGTSAGVIMFYHLFKTGGTTIRANFRNMPNVRFQRLSYYDGLNWTKYNIEPILSRLDNTTSSTCHHLVEWHIDHPAPGYPTILDLEPHLKRWRKLSSESGVPFFIFSLLRDPLAFSVSYFNQFNAHHHYYAWNPYPDLVNATEENFVKTFVPNRQCLILASSPTGVPLDRPVSRHECLRVQQVLMNNFDWVGTTERMQTETLPLLLHLLSKDDYLSRLKLHNQSSKKRGLSLSLSGLSNETVALVKKGSGLDQRLYDDMLEVFPIERMKSRYGWREDRF